MAVRLAYNDYIQARHASQRCAPGGLFFMDKKKKFGKKSLLINDQIDLLTKRKLRINNLDQARFCLETVGYYRLSAYFKPFLVENDNDDHLFKPDSTFEQIWQIYVFDRELRLHLSDALERIEIALRAALTNVLSEKYGNLWYLSKEPFQESWIKSKPDKTKKKKISSHQYFVNEIKKICKDKKEDFLKHYYTKYHHPDYPPSWMMMECLSFGKCTSLFNNLKELKDKKMISKVFGFHASVMISVLEPLRYTRNICAHHSRLWNRWFVYSPKHFEALSNLKCSQNTFHMQAYVIDKLNEAISPGSKWKERLFHLFEKYSKYVPFEHMGFQSDWKNDLFWK